MLPQSFTILKHFTSVSLMVAVHFDGTDGQKKRRLLNSRTTFTIEASCQQQGSSKAQIVYKCHQKPTNKLLPKSFCFSVFYLEKTYTV